MSMEINYTERMLNYYPEAIKAILEFQAIIDSEAPEVQSGNASIQRVIDDAYLHTMSEERIIQWEKVLGIKVRDGEGKELKHRRDTVIARIRGQGKLNTKKINEIVEVFTEGTATSWVKNRTLYVEVTPPPDNKNFVFENLEQELKRKIPAHFGFKVKRNYFTWGQVYDLHKDEVEINDQKVKGWGRVFAENNPDDTNTLDNGWQEVLIFVPEGFESGGTFRR